MFWLQLGSLFKALFHTQLLLLLLFLQAGCLEGLLSYKFFVELRSHKVGLVLKRVEQTWRRCEGSIILVDGGVRGQDFLADFGLHCM